MEYKYSQEISEKQKVIDSIVPRMYSIKEAQRRSMTINQFTSKLHAMVDTFYSTKV